MTAEPASLAAREAVRDTLAAYTHAGDRYRLDDLAALFTEDGVLEIRGREPARGRAAIVAALTAPGGESRTTRFFVRHFVTNVWFEELTVDVARVASYFAVLTPSGLDHWGRYRDELVPVGDRWLFRHRRVTVDAAAPDSSVPAELLR
ncbi:nuclear transport factor 2 family protein [Cryptosporangium aurantiacum]|uniref:SnoaL-like domain-containing protein n=1 Tax=Cryptosporangium aurantiacum TaxID=134849 RepID=A0A1M7PJH2_9ACTN|nr:nuclear transport factor 2 family protein [Cryptosporangium aurantiacum]SHN17149.1 SnoaL-like domain-containing protein [Cryptosporangium aurantiacum]